MEKSLIKELHSREVEVMYNGTLYLPKAKVLIGGTFNHWLNDDLSTLQHDPNIVVDEGLNHTLDVTLSAATQLTTWYVGIYKNNYTPVAGDTASTFAGAGVANEVTATTDVDETVRETWVEAGVTAKSITNSASPASYTAAGALAINGAFLISNNTIGGTTGTLFAASKFAATRNLIATDVLNITYTINIADA